MLNFFAESLKVVRWWFQEFDFDPFFSFCSECVAEKFFLARALKILAPFIFWDNFLLWSPDWNWHRRKCSKWDKVNLLKMLQNFHFWCSLHPLKMFCLRRTPWLCNQLWKWPGLTLLKSIHRDLSIHIDRVLRVTFLGPLWWSVWVWPDLAKCCHFVNILKSLAFVWGSIRHWAKFSNTFGMFWQFLNWCKWQINEQII